MADGSVAYGSLPFKEQIAFFRAKKNVLTDSWTDLWQSEHDHGFMVAGANRVDLLVDLRAAIDKAIADGTGLEAFRRDFDKIVATYGWQYNGGRNWRTRVIFETNLRTSYAAGRYAQLQNLKRVMPYWRYRHSDAVVHPRPLHLSWNNLVLLADDPWWDGHFGPNGWGCQCTVEALDARGLKRLGKTKPDTAPPIDMQQVTVGKNGPHPITVETPAGVDPGFGYTPGKRAFEQLTQGLVTKAARLPAALGAEAVSPVLTLQRAQQALDTAFETFRMAVAAGNGTNASSVMVSALDPLLVRSLVAAGITPSNASIAVDASVVGNIGGGLPLALRSAQAVLLDPATGQLLFVSSADANGTVRVIPIRIADTSQSTNVALGDEDVRLAILRDRLRRGELQLVQGKI